jgi:hypothetical protein
VTEKSQKTRPKDPPVFVGCRVPESWFKQISDYQKARNGEASHSSFYRQAIRERMVSFGLLGGDAA